MPKPPTALPIPEAALGMHIGVLGKTGAGVIVPTPEDCAYAAGFFDGEGTVFIAINRGAKGARGPIYNMRVTAAQVDPTPLAWLQERWGGSLAERRPRGSQRLSYVWNCFARQAARFLTDVRPFLLVKIDEADLALEFQASLFNPGVRGHTPEYRAQQDARRLQLMELKRGRERLAV